ncbi:uncharacterized protein LOC132926589 isoform X2 [Rhopalosiphum padi]|uniref:uncharacterized protein LOC132926589 isoform X2 n=1 Tax=Rhopalosiphum padi TaxID=40932 RepID=UPI00298E516C|nr:uncharacterized protein LOC132926589 isoform X2 [Rhopalosiphum padi]
MQASTSPAFAPRRPSALRVDGAGGQRTTTAAAFSSVDRLLADIAYQRQKERQRVAVNGRQSRQSRRHRYDSSRRSASTSATATTNCVTTTGSELDDEAASAYWWTDVFLRYFVFDEDCTKTTATADSDDLLFFVRRRRNRRKCSKSRSSSSQRRRKVTYDTRAYRKQQHNQQQQQQQQQKPTLLPIGDPAILWRQTVCLNAIVHRLRYTLTVAVCVRVPRKAATCFGHCDSSREFESADDGQGDCEYDLQLLSRYVHTVYASTSGRRMDAAKGPRERPVYPALCWAVDDFAEAFRTVIVRPGQTVCAELVATWPGPATVVEEYHNNDNDDGNDKDLDDGNCNQFSRHKSTPVKLKQNQNRAVLFTGAVPYAAVRAAYECKMSLYRNAERQRRKRWRQQQRKRGGKKSSLGAALSASLTALFVGGSKDSAPSSDCGEYDCYYGASSSTAVADADRVEYVTVRGCRPSCDDDSGGELSSDDENRDGDDSDFDADDSCTKGLAQMAVTLAPIQPVETVTSGFDGNVHNNHHYHQQECGGREDDCGETRYDQNPDFTTSAYYDQDNDDYTTVIGYQQQQLESFTTPGTASEPGDYYDYGWDYETAASSEQQTPQTPSYYYQQQQQQQLERQRRRGRKPRRLSDPCSTSIFDQLDNNDHGTEQHRQPYQQQYEINNYNSMCGKKSRRKQQYNYQHRLQQQLNSYGSVRGLSSVASTPGKSGKMQHPHRAWSESDGLDQYGGGFVQQIQNQQKPQLLLPPPVPYYCAAEAAESGFAQYVHKSPGGWWIRTKNKRRRRRHKSTKRKQSGKTNTTVIDRRRSSSAGPNGYTVTDDENSYGSDSGSNSDHSQSNSDEQESDGEFIGALAAAASFGQDPDREWLQRGSAGDPVADWDRYDCESDSSAEPNDDNMVEWTTEIMATDIRRKQPPNCSTIAMSSRMERDNSLNFCDEQTPTPVFTNRHVHHQPKQQSVGHSQQSQRQLLVPQFRPQPLEPPPPPALSVAFTAVACPWWTVLEDVLHVNAKTSGEQLSSNKKITRLPLLTFD